VIGVLLINTIDIYENLNSKRLLNKPLCCVEIRF
jgi:hypothetical protein